MSLLHFHLITKVGVRRLSTSVEWAMNASWFHPAGNIYLRKAVGQKWLHLISSEAQVQCGIPIMLLMGIMYAKKALPTPLRSVYQPEPLTTSLLQHKLRFGGLGKIFSFGYSSFSFSEFFFSQGGFTERHWGSFFFPSYGAAGDWAPCSQAPKQW